MNASAPQPAPRMRLWRPLQGRNFRLLWIGETVSLLGDQCYFVALPWLVLQLTGSGLALGTVMMTAATPRAVFMLVGGATSDRIAPRMVMVASDCLRAMVVGGITLLMVMHALRFAPNVWTAAALVFPMGIGGGFTNIILVSWLQRRSEPQMIGRLMSLVMLGSTGLQPFSYVLAGALVDWHLKAMFVGAGCLMLLTGIFCATNPVVRTIE